MKPESAVFHQLRPPVEDLTLSVRTVSRLARCGPSKRWTPAVESAIEQARRLILPQGRWTRLDESDITRLFPSETPVEAIVRHGEPWAFVATIGRRLEEHVKDLFDEKLYLEAVLLDAAGSTAVEALCDELERACAREESSARFSPGYCGWSLEGQHGLFAILKPDEIGVHLLPSLLMQPLKSVSGVVVRAEPETLRVPPSACEACDARGCTRRQSRRRQSVGREV